MTVTTAIVVALLLPLVCALLLPLAGERNRNLREGISLGTSGILLYVIVRFILPQVQAGKQPALKLLSIMPGLDIGFKVEALGMLFALVASGLWIVTTAYAIGYMRGHHEVKQTRFFVCFAVAIFSALGIAFAANLATLFVFYEVLTLSTYPLVTHHGTEKARKAGRVYLGILLTTSMGFLMVGIVWTYLLAGTLDFRAGGILGKANNTQLMILLGLFAFGTGKAALMPFHRWLPAAMVAPTPVSALLHAVAVVKAGVFTIMKVTIYIFGIERLTSTGASTWLMYVACFTLLASSVIALRKQNLKERLAYSTISQLSYIVLGAAIANTSGVLGGSMHIAMHAFGKITLFFCAGAIYVAAHKTEVSELNGLGWKMPFTMTAFLIGSLCVIGLPPSGGSWSKWFLILGAQERGHQVMSIALMVSSLLSIAYLMPVVARAFFYPSEHGTRGTEKGDSPLPTFALKEAPLFCVVPLCITALGCVVLFFYAQGLYNLLLKITF